MVAFLLAVALSAAPASSSMSPEDQARFKGHFTRAEVLYAEGELGGAIWNFRQADALWPTPEGAFNLAKAHQKLSDDAFAAYYFRLYLRRAPKASDALEIAEWLAGVLGSAEARGEGLLELESSGAQRAKVAGRSHIELPVAVFLPEGDHEVVAHFPDAEERSTASVSAGRAQLLTLERQVPLVESVPAQRPSALQAAVAVSDSRGLSESGRQVLHYGGLGVGMAGVAALVAGAVLGSLSTLDASRAQSAEFASDAQHHVRSANGRGRAANVLFVAGPALAVIGGVGFVLTLPEPGGE